MEDRIAMQKAGFTSDGGTNHEHFKKGKVTVLVKRHREIPDEIAKKILRLVSISYWSSWGRTQMM